MGEILNVTAVNKSTLGTTERGIPFLYYTVIVLTKHWIKDNEVKFLYALLYLLLYQFIFHLFIFSFSRKKSKEKKKE